MRLMRLLLNYQGHVFIAGLMPGVNSGLLWFCYEFAFCTLYRGVALYSAWHCENCNYFAKGRYLLEMFGTVDAAEILWLM